MSAGAADDPGDAHSSPADSSDFTPLVQKEVATSARSNINDITTRAIQPVTNEVTTKAVSATGDLLGPSVALLCYMEHLKPALNTEDAEKAFKLIEQFPHLHVSFTVIAAFLITFDQHPHDYNLLYGVLKAVHQTSSPTRENRSIQALCRFAVVTGFVQRSVHLYRQIVQEKGLADTVKITNSAMGFMGCLYHMMSVFLHYTHHSADFRLSLVETGVLADFMQSIQALKDKSDDFLESYEAYFLYMMCLENLCKSSDILPAIRRLSPVEHLTPFLSRHNPVLKLTALMTLATLMDEAESKQLMADGDILAFFLHHFQQALQNVGKFSLLKSHKTGHYCICVDDFLEVANGLAKNDSNKRLLCEKGCVPLLVSVLESGTEDEKRLAMGIIWELAFDPENSRHIGQNERLMKILNDIKNSMQRSSCYAANAVWVISNRTDGESRIGARSADPSPADGTGSAAGYSRQQPTPKTSLQQSNLMAILGKSEVEIMIERLGSKQRTGQQATTDYSRTQTLQALADLLQETSRRTEFLDKGGLGVLIPSLENGTAQEKLHVLYALLELVKDREVCATVKAQARLVALADQLKKSEDKALAQIAQRLARILQSGDVCEEASSGYVLVSCHKGDNVKASLVCEYLRSQQYKVQLHSVKDTNDMEEDQQSAMPTPEQTSLPVDSASAVVLCVSHRYKMNALCRMQCEYAAKLQKLLVAVHVDQDYRPDGWLQILINDKVKVLADVTDAAKRDRGLKQMVVALGSHGKGT